MYIVPNTLNRTVFLLNGMQTNLYNQEQDASNAIYIWQSIHGCIRGWDSLVTGIFIDVGSNCLCSVTPTQSISKLQFQKWINSYVDNMSRSGGYVHQLYIL